MDMREEEEKLGEVGKESEACAIMQ